jgi:2'-5' RNA ligase
MSNSLRLFFAVEVPSQIKSELEAFCRGVDKEHWRAVNPAQLHITLAFMGEVPEDALEKVIAAGKAAAGQVKPFTVELCDTGVFPESAEPRVLYAGVNAPEISSLAAFFRDELGSLTDQKKFRPHLTLARRRAERARKDLRKIRADWLVSSFTLFKSTLTDSGPRHEVVQSFSLG